jgi:hypothetical protein
MRKQVRRYRKRRKSRLETLRQEKVSLEQNKRIEKRRKKMTDSKEKKGKTIGRGNMLLF